MYLRTVGRGIDFRCSAVRKVLAPASPQGGVPVSGAAREMREGETPWRRTDSNGPRVLWNDAWQVPATGPRWLTSARERLKRTSRQVQGQHGRSVECRPRGLRIMPQRVNRTRLTRAETHVSGARVLTDPRRARHFFLLSVDTSCFSARRSAKDSNRILREPSSRGCGSGLPTTLRKNSEEFFAP